MRVLCIQCVRTTGPRVSQKPIVVEGEVYTVIDHGHQIDGTPAYEIAEHKGFWYSTDLFIPLSDVDPMEETTIDKELQTT